MEIISNTIDFQLNKDSAISIGKFDGVHIGHRYLINEIVATAQKRNLASVVFTFSPSPESLFSGQLLPELTTPEEKRNILAKLGVDVLIEFPMTFETAATEPERFISEYLVKQMRAKYISAGEDVSYGNKGMGNAKLLKDMAEEYDYECHIINKLFYDGVQISSTLVRNTVEAGDMELAASLLGSPYRITGEISHGQRLGRTIGMPTANIIIPSGKITGPVGVYVSKSYVGSSEYASISNIGYKPTVTEAGELCCETYLYGYAGDLYERHMEVELLCFTRPERKFSSVEELKKQMEQDILFGKKYHGID